MSSVRYALVLLALFIVAAGAWKLQTLENRVARDERQTCIIQARGLPAGHQLAASFKDVYLLLTLPPSPDAPPVPAGVRRLVLALDGHLAAYLHAEAAQPARRSC